jgi:(p)ppGpp synthase/HD superfamily hydrolase
MPNRISDKPPVPPPSRPGSIAKYADPRQVNLRFNDPRLITALHSPLPGAVTYFELRCRLIDQLEIKGIPIPDLAPLDKSFELASEAHRGQTRATGAPYITHPLELAEEVLKAGWLEVPVLCAALLHDSVEDTAEKPDAEKITVGRIRRELGVEISDLVNGMTKLRKIGMSKEIRDVRNLKKWINFIRRDVRVAVLKLFDRMVNSRTFSDLEPERAQKNAFETLDIYVPVAHGLGLSRVKAELEENSFRILYPEECNKVTEMIDVEGGRALGSIERTKEELLEKLGTWGAEIEYSREPFANIFRRYQLDPNLSIEDTLHNFVVEVPEEICYEILGILHKPENYHYVQRTLEDYMSNPTGSRFRGLLTTVMTPGIGNTTFRIMSPEMKKLADWGPLQSYDPLKLNWHLEFSRQFRWIEDMVAYLRREKKLSEHDIRDMTQGAVYSIQVYTDRMDPVNIPMGATALDFAYRIHSELGHTASAARIYRGKRRILDEEMNFPLRPFDRVEIITSPGLTPVLEDLRRVATSHARNEILSFLKNQSREVSIETGRARLGEQMLAVTGPTSPRKCYLKPADLEATREVRGETRQIFEGYFRRLSNLLGNKYPLKRADDLNYLVGIGQISPEKAAQELLTFLHEARRKTKKPHILEIKFETADRPGILADMARPIADLHLNIVQVNTTYKGKNARLSMGVRVYNEVHRMQVENIISTIEGVKDIILILTDH